jgi:hypothetical protein
MRQIAQKIKNHNKQEVWNILRNWVSIQIRCTCRVSVLCFTVFTVFRLLTDFVCLYNYEFWLSLCKIVRSSVILLLPLFHKTPTKHVDIQAQLIICGQSVLNIPWMSFMIEFLLTWMFLSCLQWMSLMWDYALQFFYIFQDVHFYGRI